MANKNQDVRAVTAFNGFDIGSLVSLGIRRFSAEYVCAVKRLDRSEARQAVRRTAWRKIGDTYYFVGAYRNAHRCYRRAGSLSTVNSGVWEDLLDSSVSLGLKYASRQAIKRCFQSGMSRDSIDAQITTSEARKGRVHAESSVACDQIVSGKGMRLIHILRARRSRKVLQWIAQAYCALNNIEAARSVWEEIWHSQVEFGMRVFDWFVLPDDLWWDEDFWKGMLTAQQQWRFELDGWWGTGVLESFTSRVSWEKQTAIVFRLHLARCAGDRSTIRKIGSRFKNCNVAREWGERLKLGSRWRLSAIEKGLAVHNTGRRGGTAEWHG